MSSRYRKARRRIIMDDDDDDDDDDDSNEESVEEEEPPRRRRQRRRVIAMDDEDDEDDNDSDNGGVDAFADGNNGDDDDERRKEEVIPRRLLEVGDGGEDTHQPDDGRGNYDNHHDDEEYKLLASSDDSVVKMEEDEQPEDAKGSIRRGTRYEGGVEQQQEENEQDDNDISFQDDPLLIAPVRMRKHVPEYKKNPFSPLLRHPDTMKADRNAQGCGDAPWLSSSRLLRERNNVLKSLREQYCDEATWEDFVHQGADTSRERQQRGCEVEDCFTLNLQVDSDSSCSKVERGICTLQYLTASTLAILREQQSQEKGRSENDSFIMRLPTKIRLILTQTKRARFEGSDQYNKWAESGEDPYQMIPSDFEEETDSSDEDSNGEHEKAHSRLESSLVGWLTVLKPQQVHVRFVFCKQWSEDMQSLLYTLSPSSFQQLSASQSERQPWIGDGSYSSLFESTCQAGADRTTMLQDGEGAGTAGKPVSTSRASKRIMIPFCLLNPLLDGSKASITSSSLTAGDSKSQDEVSRGNWRITHFSVTTTDKGLRSWQEFVMPYQPTALHHKELCILKLGGVEFSNAEGWNEFVVGITGTGSQKGGSINQSPMKLSSLCLYDTRFGQALVNQHIPLETIINATSETLRTFHLTIDHGQRDTTDDVVPATCSIWSEEFSASVVKASSRSSSSGVAGGRLGSLILPWCESAVIPLLRHCASSNSTLHRLEIGGFVFVTRGDPGIAERWHPNDTYADDAILKELEKEEVLCHTAMSNSTTRFSVSIQKQIHHNTDRERLVPEAHMRSLINQIPTLFGSTINVLRSPSATAPLLQMFAGGTSPTQKVDALPAPIAFTTVGHGIPLCRVSVLDLCQSDPFDEDMASKWQTCLSTYPHLQSLKLNLACDIDHLCPKSNLVDLHVETSSPCKPIRVAATVLEEQTKRLGVFVLKSKHEGGYHVDYPDDVKYRPGRRLGPDFYDSGQDRLEYIKDQVEQNNSRVTVQDESQLERFSKALREHPTMQNLQLELPNASREFVPTILRSIARNSVLKELDLSGTSYNRATQVVPLIPILEFLEEIAFSFFSYQRDDMKKALQANTSIWMIKNTLPRHDTNWEIIERNRRICMCLSVLQPRKEPGPVPPAGLWPHVLFSLSQQLGQEDAKDALYAVLQRSVDGLCQTLGPATTTSKKRGAPAPTP